MNFYKENVFKQQGNYKEKTDHHFHCSFWSQTSIRLGECTLPATTETERNQEQSGNNGPTYNPHIQETEARGPED